MSADHHDHHLMLQTDGSLLHQQFHWKNKHHSKQWSVYVTAMLLIGEKVLCIQMTGSWVGPRSKYVCDGKKNIFCTPAGKQIQVNALHSQSQYSQSYFCSEGICVTRLKWKSYATCMMQSTQCHPEIFSIDIFLTQLQAESWYNTLIPQLISKLWIAYKYGVLLNAVLLYCTAAWKQNKKKPAYMYL